MSTMEPFCKELLKIVTHNIHIFYFVVTFEKEKKSSIMRWKNIFCYRFRMCL